MVSVNVRALQPMKQITNKKPMKKVLIAAAGGNGGEPPFLDNTIKAHNIRMQKFMNHIPNKLFK